MTLPQSVKDAVRAFLSKAKAQEGERLHSAVLFGSHARGEARPDSDVDVAVILRGAPGDFVDAKLALADLAYEVLLESGLLIQPLPIWEDEWASPSLHRNPRLVENIHKEGIVL